MDWKEVYKLPLKYSPWCSCIVWSDNMVHALDIFVDDDSGEVSQLIVDVLNGMCSRKFEIIEEKPTVIKLRTTSHDVKIVIRGWGHLTGIGGLNLLGEEAAKIQDDFQKWIVNKLKKENNDA